MFAHLDSLSTATASTINGVSIMHESMGDESAPCIFICNGMGMTMTYTGGFAERFVEQGFRVIRFDWRDAGESQKFDAEWPNPPDVNPTLKPIPPPAFAAYDLDDLAADAIGVLDHYNVSSAHVYGFSMGNVVAQILAVKHPARCLSLVLHMGFVDLTACWARAMEKDGGKYFQKVGAMRAKYPPPSRDMPYEDWLTRHTEFFCGTVGGGDLAYPTTMPLIKDLVRRWGEEDYARGAIDWSGNGSKRHMLATVSWSTNRAKLAAHVEGLRQLQVPTLCLHGLHDLLCPPETGGREIARHVPNARVVEYHGAHNFGNHKSVYELVFAAALEHVQYHSTPRTVQVH